MISRAASAGQKASAMRSCSKTREAFGSIREASRANTAMVIREPLYISERNIRAIPKRTANRRFCKPNGLQRQHIRWFYDKGMAVAS